MLRRNPPNQDRQQRQPQAPQPQHANYTGTSIGYSSFPQANMAAAACKSHSLVLCFTLNYGLMALLDANEDGGYPQMQMQNYGYQYPQA